MNVCILMGSPRPTGNTATLLQPFIAELEALGAEVEYIPLFERHIEPCRACWTCQNIHDRPGCPQRDDMGAVYDAVLRTDCVVFATPIYSWYCTPPMKAAMDRLVYGLNKYYGDVEGDSLWKGRKCALVATCGYELEWGAGVFEEGLRRYCQHSKLDYIGKIAVRDIDGREYFRNDEAVALARGFAQKIIAEISQGSTS